ncbi:MAG TPA: MATE family efflux transporter [Tepidisphaeraceae bacterium]|nr:MATE family efflux transporter [Tepidisphaeraceae bacterium]
MSQAAATERVGIKLEPVLSTPSNAVLLRQLVLLALPVFAEQVLHMLVALTDTFVANHLVKLTPDMTAAQIAEGRTQIAAATAAVGTIGYIFWLIGLITGAIGTGSTAIIARATGARHRRLANSVCGQSVGAALFAGLGLWLIFGWGAPWVANIAQLHGIAHDFALDYLRMLGISLPFVTVMMVANACLRGAGDTVTPAVSMIIVDLVNMFFTWSLTFGSFHLPRMGFDGIAVGTVIAYIAGGVLQFSVLLIGRGGIRLYLHRLRPHWHNLKRVLRIGLPSGVGDLLQWSVNFGLIMVINLMDPSNASAAAHTNAIRIESLSYLSGFAVATAAATMVGQALGMKDPHRATRSANLAYLLGGGFMGTMGLIFIFAGSALARVISADPHIAELTAKCLFITGFCQTGFAAAMVYGGALRGAGDTLMVMVMSLISIFTLRLGAVLIIGLWLRMGLAAIWIFLASELFVRGILIYSRFRSGGWKKIQV